MDEQLTLAKNKLESLITIANTCGTFLEQAATENEDFTIKLNSEDKRIMLNNKKLSASNCNTR
jgi:hypothetical protein